tara:strand:+ start:291 stop:1673 length:1383 start_codon:yes stop_codon:yes gene_type:complete
MEQEANLKGKVLREAIIKTGLDIKTVANAFANDIANFLGISGRAAAQMLTFIGQGENTMAQSQALLGQGFESNPKIVAFMAGLTGDDYNPLDEIDEQRQAAAGEAPEDVIEVAQREYANMTQQVAETSRRRARTEPTIDEQREKLFAEYKEDKNTDKLLSGLQDLENVEAIVGTEYAFESQYLNPDTTAYYGFDASPYALETYRAQANDQDLVPLYNSGLHLSFLNNMPSERIIDFQLALEAANFLDPANITGVFDEATQQALQAAFTYMNPKTEFGINVNDLNDIAIASGGNNAAFLGFVHDIFLDQLDDIDPTDVDPDKLGPNITVLPDSEMLGQQIENAISQYSGLPSMELLLPDIRDWANGKIKELNDKAAEVNQLSANQYNMAARDAARRRKFGLEPKEYEVRGPIDREDLTNAFEFELDKYIKQTFAPLIEANQVDQARRQGIASLISAFSVGR